MKKYILLFMALTLAGACVYSRKHISVEIRNATDPKVEVDQRGSEAEGNEAKAGYNES